ncbi:MAG TPA: 16S rRNA (cytosine(1402)-N(4))-methyltransferase RsmH [Planctomycetota bacterium]|nr:16S rRNA (cytosine(1402)-N(4))-methyltransferase RsmH [Planctomycetota bacterium]
MPVHIPVLLEETLEILNPKPGQLVVDCTVGLGGHARELLARVSPGGTLVGLDLDPHNLEAARPRLEEAGGTFELHHANFAGILKVLAGRRADALLADLGVSSPHLDDPARGFSLRRPGPLDMRLDPTRGPTAADLVNRMGERELADAIFELGDETDSRKIARLIVERRRRGRIETTDALADIIGEARRFTRRRAAGAKLHPATRTFQALRILVNRELENLDALLAVLPSCLAPGGRAAIISFHSGEDRRVKRSFRDGKAAGLYSDIGKLIRTGDREAVSNPRARSAKLRWALA